MLVSVWGRSHAESDPAPAAPAPAAAAQTVTWANDTLSLRVDKMPVADLLQQITKQTGAELKGRPVTDREISLQFDGLSLEESLHRILGSQNFTLRFAANGSPSVIELLGGPEAPVQQAKDTSPAMGITPNPDRPALPPRLGFPRTFPSRRQLDLPEVLQKVVGSKSATFDQTFDIATLHKEALTRAMASQVVLSQIERDRRVRRSVLSAMAKLDDATLENFRGTVEGERVHDLLEFLSVHAREPSLQHKATIALDRFQAATTPAAN